MSFEYPLADGRTVRVEGVYWPAESGAGVSPDYDEGFQVEEVTFEGEPVEVSAKEQAEMERCFLEG